MHSEKRLEEEDDDDNDETRGYQKLLLLAADAECKEETDAAAENQNFEFVPVPCD